MVTQRGAKVPAALVREHSPATFSVVLSHIFWITERRLGIAQYGCHGWFEAYGFIGCKFVRYNMAKTRNERLASLFWLSFWCIQNGFSKGRAGLTLQTSHMYPAIINR